MMASSSGFRENGGGAGKIFAECQNRPNLFITKPLRNSQR